jgi:hypothetical protein
VFTYRALKAGEYRVCVTVRMRPGTFHVTLADLLHARVESGTTTTLNYEFARSRRNAALRGSFTAPDTQRGWSVAVYDASTTAAVLPNADRLRGTAYNFEKIGRYSIAYLAPGTYEVVGLCYPKERKEGQRGGPSLATTKTITLRDGETATVDFDLK